MAAETCHPAQHRTCGLRSLALCGTHCQLRTPRKCRRPIRDGVGRDQRPSWHPSQVIARTGRTTRPANLRPHAARGDSFCGGGSIPFEAARIGCKAFGSDLNPVAGLLTWASVNLLCGGKAVQDDVLKVQEAVFAAADKQITSWGIEHNDRGERAEAYVYCIEVKPEGCDYYIPLAPSWLVDEFCKVGVQWDRPLGADHLTPQILLVPQGEIADLERR